MDISYSKYEELLNILKKSCTEEEIIDTITIIVKKFHPDLWKEIIFSNPYYKSLFEDIKLDILSNLDDIRGNILKEIDSIDKEIRSGNSNLNQFIQLKVECQLLLIEVDYKIEELKSI
jgi:hypothetical protein